MIDSRLLEILCCPASHNDTTCYGELEEKPGGLRCYCCGSFYPIDDDVPIMTSRQNQQESQQ